MIDTVTKPKTKVQTKAERPRLHKVILVNDDLHAARIRGRRAEGRIPDDRGPGPPGHDHRAPARRLRGRGFHQGRRRDQGHGATDAGRAKGYPLLFTTEPEE